MFGKRKNQDEYDEYYEAPEESGDEAPESESDDGERGLAQYRTQSFERIPRGSMILSESELMGGEEDEEDDTELRDYHPIRFRRDGRTGLLGGIMYAVFVISVSVILACMAWMFASDVLALNKRYTEATVTVPEYVATAREIAEAEAALAEDPEAKGVKNVDANEVAKILKDAGVIEYEFLFKLYAKVSSAAWKIEPGTYVLTTDYDYRALVKKMQIGSESQVETTVTFPEGFTMRQIFERLEENHICSTDDLYAQAADYSYSYAFLDDLDMGDATRLEGYLFPDTYNFYQGMQASGAINKLLQRFHYILTEEMYARAQDMGLSLHQIVIVASMIEKEAGSDEERATIASVIYNRLNAGMPLGVDATILYEFPDWSGTSIPDNILGFDSPYNTRLYTGLPPSPICSPGLASINAACKPESTNYYYYALDAATGTHRFFTNASDFNAFVATQSY